MHLVSAIALAMVCLVLATSAGATVLRLARFRFASPLELVLYSVAIGFALTSYSLFALGSLGWLNLGMALFVLACMAAVGTPSLWRGATWLLDKRPWLKLLRRRLSRSHWPELLLVSLFGCFAVLNLFGALAPPTEWDSLDHHLGAVKFFIMQGRISFVPYRGWATPFTAEMWNMLGLLLGSNILPQLFQYSMGLVSALALYLVARNGTLSRAALLAATIYYTSPHIFTLSTSAKSDLAWLLFVFLSLQALLTWQRRDDIKFLILSGVFTGLTLATKFQGFLWAPAIGAALLLSLWPVWRQRPLAAAGCVFIFGLIAGIVVAPWWLRNWLAGGDPIWPYGYPIFHSRFWTQELHDKYATWTQGPGDSAWHYVTGLWNLTVNQSAWLFGLRSPITPVPLAFIPGLALVWLRMRWHTRRFFGLILVPILVYYTLWFKGYQNARYLLPSLTLLMIPAAYIYWEFVKVPVLRLVGTGLLVSSIGLFVAYNLVFNAQFVPVVLGLQPPDEFLAQRVSYYEDIQWANSHLPAGTRLLFFHLKSFYLDLDFVRGDGNIVPIAHGTATDVFVGYLRAEGITHIFLPEMVAKDNETAIGSIVAELRRRGILVPVYSNPQGRWVESRTLAIARPVRVEILGVIYPESEDLGQPKAIFDNPAIMTGGGY